MGDYFNLGSPNLLLPPSMLFQGKPRKWNWTEEPSDGYSPARGRAESVRWHGSKEKGWGGLTQTGPQWDHKRTHKTAEGAVPSSPEAPPFPALAMIHPQGQSTPVAFLHGQCPVRRAGGGERAANFTSGPVPAPAWSVQPYGQPAHGLRSAAGGGKRQAAAGGGPCLWHQGNWLRASTFSTCLL